jgi:hypothetical protein
MEEAKEQWLKSLNVLHLALVIGMSIFLGLVCFLKKDVLTFQTSSDTMPFTVVGLVLGLGVLFVGPLLFNARIKAASGTLNQKLNTYRQAFVVKMAVLEGAAIFNILVLFLFGSGIQLLVATLLLCFMVMQKPSAFKISEALQLNYEEKSLLGV